MKKLMNEPKNFEQETLEGILLAHEGKVKLHPEDKRILLSGYASEDKKVGIVTGGGSGHLPVFLGYVGRGMLDGCAVGNVFASPSANTMAKMIKSCDRGSGVLCLYGNYGGDNLNFDMACETVDMDDIKTATIRVNDDVASSGPDSRDKRRGVAGMVYAFKIAGAAANRMKSLDEVTQITGRALENIRTMGVALSPCIVPQVGKPTFTIGEDELEVGMGIHGEPGIEVTKIKSADEVAQIILDKIIADLPLKSGDTVSVMVNGLGSTPLEELYIVYRRVHIFLKELGVTVFMPHVGEFATSMEMAGLSVTVFKLDAELQELLCDEAVTPFYTNTNK